MVQLYRGDTLRFIVMFHVAYMAIIYLVIPLILSIFGAHLYFYLDELMDSYYEAVGINATPGMIPTTGMAVFQRKEREKARRFFTRFRLGCLFPSEHRLANLWGALLDSIKNSVTG